MSTTRVTETAITSATRTSAVSGRLVALPGVLGIVALACLVGAFLGVNLQLMVPSGLLFALVGVVAGHQTRSRARAAALSGPSEAWRSAGLMFAWIALGIWASLLLMFGLLIAAIAGSGV